MKAKNILFFMQSLNIRNLQWGAYYGNCDQTWKELYSSEDDSVILNDHITIYWPAYTNNEKLYKTLLDNSDKRTLDSEGRLMFHIFID